MRDELEVTRLASTLDKLQNMTLQWKEIERATPFAFPLIVERLRESVSTEKLADRISPVW